MIEIQYKILTPLWTDGVDGTADRLHATGLLGSLRWWYEVMVRGLGGHACDPSQGRCAFDAKKLCDVCQIFGATGWRRRFRIAVVDDRTRQIWQGNQLLNIRPPGRNRGWFLPPGRMGAFTLGIDGESENVARVLAALRFIERWAGLGAKPQLGYGVVEIQNWDVVKERLAGFSWRQEAQSFASKNDVSNPHLPDLRDIGFFRYRFQPGSAAWWSRVGGLKRVVAQVRPFAMQTTPVAPALKNAWRFQHWQAAWGNEQLFWGRVAADRIRGKVAVSWAYPREGGWWEIRGWAWLARVQAEPVWRTLSDVAIWNDTLGVTGTLMTDPDGPWRRRTPDDLLALLEEP